MLSYCALYRFFLIFVFVSNSLFALTSDEEYLLNHCRTLTSCEFVSSKEIIRQLFTCQDKFAGDTFFIAAAKRNDVALIRKGIRLLRMSRQESGLDPFEVLKMQDNQGNSLLMHAVLLENEDLIAALFTEAGYMWHGVPNLHSEFFSMIIQKNNDNLFPLAYAITLKDQGIFKRIIDRLYFLYPTKDSAKSIFNVLFSPERNCLIEALSTGEPYICLQLLKVIRYFCLKLSGGEDDVIEGEHPIAFVASKLCLREKHQAGLLLARQVKKSKRTQISKVFEEYALLLRDIYSELDQYSFGRNLQEEIKLMVAQIRASAIFSSAQLDLLNQLTSTSSSRVNEKKVSTADLQTLPSSASFFACDVDKKGLVEEVSCNQDTYFNQHQGDSTLKRALENRERKTPSLRKKRILPSEQSEYDNTVIKDSEKNDLSHPTSLQVIVNQIYETGTISSQANVDNNHENSEEEREEGELFIDEEYESN